MGREIRRVPPNWEHPKYTEETAPSQRRVGQYKSLYDESYEHARKEWLDGFELWKKGEHPSQKYAPGQDWWEWTSPPDRDNYHPEWGETATWYQVYETVSEGSPVSPPFATKEELIEYLVANGDFLDQQRGDGGYSRESAEAFVEGAYAPSFVIANGKLMSGVEALAELPKP